MRFYPLDNHPDLRALGLGGVAFVALGVSVASLLPYVSRDTGDVLLVIFYFTPGFVLGLTAKDSPLAQARKTMALLWAFRSQVKSLGRERIKQLSAEERSDLRGRLIHATILLALLLSGPVAVLIAVLQVAGNPTALCDMGPEPLGGCDLNPVTPGGFLGWTVCCTLGLVVGRLRARSW